MARGNLKHLTPWPPGTSGNPKGRPKIPEDVKKIRKLTLDEVKEVGELLLMSPRDAAKTLSKDPEASVLKVWLARVVLKGLRFADYGMLDEILNRLIGKTPEELNIKGNVHEALVRLMAGDKPEGK